jgi:hypothetical protein
MKLNKHEIAIASVEFFKLVKHKHINFKLSRHINSRLSHLTNSLEFAKYEIDSNWISPTKAHPTDWNRQSISISFDLDIL